MTFPPRDDVLGGEDAGPSPGSTGSGSATSALGEARALAVAGPVMPSVARPSALAEYLEWTRPRVSAALRTLESHGLLDRHPGTENDQRGIERALTETGDDLATVAQRALVRHATESARCLECARLLGAHRHRTPGAGRA
jgi:DNA-binding MarR family transcriptional regulator